MAIEENEQKLDLEVSEEENQEGKGVVDLEVELVVALKEVHSRRKSHKKILKKLVEAEKMVVDLKVREEECSKMIEDLEA